MDIKMTFGCNIDHGHSHDILWQQRLKTSTQILATDSDMALGCSINPDITLASVGYTGHSENMYF